MLKESKEHDAFSKIASQEVTYRNNDLVEPRPQQLPKKQLPISETGNAVAFEAAKRISNEDELQKALQDLRDLHSPYMRKLSPPIPTTREKVQIDTFDWRVETELDREDFSSTLQGKGEWQNVSIPHYGEPLGKAVTYYRSEVEVSEEQLSKGAAFICFKGVDYKADVFVNGYHLGSHEGFFAPFEFDFTAVARPGRNAIVVKVQNDFICGSNTPWGDSRSGDKIYAATNQGYDDAELGWHHCPPGMGIYQTVSLEFRQKLFVSDIFVRPLPFENKAEIWIEANHTKTNKEIGVFSISIHGRNFEQKVIEGLKHEPSVIHECGEGDDLQIARAKAAGIYQKPSPLKIGPGANRFRVTVDMDDFRWWSPETPWLYQVHVELLDESGQLMDVAEQHFGMRSFCMDTEDEKKGALLLNGNPVRLRGANTMGHEQQCVMKEDWDQLRDDLLLAKLCNMNFLRLTQRPVQKEVYDYCDMLGIMTQTDLPTFAVIRHTQYNEALRQVEEMERLVRPHPCNIVISYINEPVTNSGNEPHRNITRHELEDFFESADKIVKRLNPDRVIKACDGDYDPPAPGIQDRHCYCTWYNGQGLDYGKLYRGFWQPTKKDWYYGCGEFGAEGLESSDLMTRMYPKSWLPQSEDDKAWSPNQIKFAQSGRFHYFFYETPEGLEEWVEASQRYQAESVRSMTEAFRRNNDMVTIAIHLFIDAFPSGWMKTIMDCERRPKQAYYAYRDALAPLLPSLRCDRSRFFSGEAIDLEAWVCNDLNSVDRDLELRYRITDGESVIASGKTDAECESNAATFQGLLSFNAPETATRKTIAAHLAIVSKDGQTLNDTKFEIDIFPERKPLLNSNVSIHGRDGLAEELDANQVQDDATILISDMSKLRDNLDELLEKVAAGSRLVILELDPGEYQFGEHTVSVKTSTFNSLHFASRRTGHPLVADFQPHDFKHWYDPTQDRIAPFLHNTFVCDTAKPILLSGNTDENGEWTSALAAAELLHGKGSILISQTRLKGLTRANPPAYQFAQRLING